MMGCLELDILVVGERERSYSSRLPRQLAWLNRLIHDGALVAVWES